MRGECIGEAHAVGIDDVGEILDAPEATPGHAAHAAGGEAAAFLVGPGHHLDRAAQHRAGAVQRGQRLEAGDDAVDAVEATAVRLRIHVAAGDDRGGVRVSALAAQP